MSIPITTCNKNCYTNNMTKFTEFLEGCFIDWEKKTGRRRTLNEFADYLGVKRPLLSLWMSGDRRPGSKKIQQLSQLLGLEVYDSLDLPTPDPRLLYIQSNWDRMSEEGKKRIAQEAARYAPDEAHENK
jgi:transcriptional regulator with XRE-family HTH domain